MQYLCNISEMYIVNSGVNFIYQRYLELYMALAIPQTDIYNGWNLLVLKNVASG